MPPSVLAVFAHPDDESLLAGGLLARHATAGARTAIITATWASDTHRGRELADAAKLLGADVHMLGYADARVPESAPGRPRLLDAPLDAVIERIVAHIRDLRPHLVITHDAYGQLTGHPDHIHTHRLTLLAVQAAGLAHLYPQAGELHQPSAFYAATHPDSSIGELGTLLTGVGKSVRSAPDHHVTERFDVSPWLETKWRAIQAHRSQLERQRSLPAILARLPHASRQRILATEWFSRLDPTPSTDAYQARL